MAAVIIRKVDVNRIGKELIKEVYDFLHDEYIISEFEDMKILQEKFLKDVVYKRFSHYNKEKTTTYSGGNFSSSTFRYKNFDESKFDEELKGSTEQIKDGTMDIHVIYDVLKKLDLDFEINEDLYFKKKSFLDIYSVFETGYIYLEE